MATSFKPRVAVVGGGWSGLAAAVRATQAQWDVTLFDMAPQLGGRARSLQADGHVLDNGQHIMIGAYSRTLALMQTLGVPTQQVFDRRPLALVDARGRGLALPAGPPTLALLRGVMRNAQWSWADRLALLRGATRWLLQGFRCDAATTVAELTSRWPATLRADLIDPLCVAALNTPAAQASGAVFLRVLQDALTTGPGSSDLLLPRQPLSALLPEPAAAWLAARGAQVRLRHRVQQLLPNHQAEGWCVDAEPFDAVILAASAAEAARLTAPWSASWSAQAAAVRYQSIVTVYVEAAGARLPSPMHTLSSDANHPAQFVFDLGQLGQPQGRLAMVVSGANEWLVRGLDATAHASVQQLRAAWPDAGWAPALRVLQSVAEKRATFACVPGLVRPTAAVAGSRLMAAGDYVQGPYPATLEGAVRSGEFAVRQLQDTLTGQNGAREH